MPHEIQNLRKVSKSVVHIQENLAFEADVENTWCHVSPLMVSLRHSRLLALWFGSSRSNQWFRSSRERMMTRSPGPRNPLIRYLSRSSLTRNSLSFMGPTGGGGSLSVSGKWIPWVVHPPYSRPSTSASPVCKSIDCPPRGRIS